MPAATIQVDTLVTGDFVENGYIIRRKGASEAVLIDPGAEPQRWQEWLAAHNVQPVLILATHAHLDHVGAIDALAERYEAPFALHADEVQVLDMLDWQCRLFGLAPIPRPRVARTLQDGDQLEEADLTIECLAMPGHTPGGLAYHLAESKQVFTGDSLFAGTIGRTDLPGGHHETLIRSLKRLAERLPDDTQVLPGHGPPTTIGTERTSNPFFRVERAPERPSHAQEQL